MRETIGCCISCILPCGALDVIRIIHTNGHVEKIGGRSVVLASDIMKLYPKHILKKPSSPSEDSVVPGIIVLNPDVELQRGKIYFLVPLPPSAAPGKGRLKSSAAARRKRSKCNHLPLEEASMTAADGGVSVTTNLLDSDRLLRVILSEKVSTQRDGGRGWVAVWRPHWESILETR